MGKIENENLASSITVLTDGCRFIGRLFCTGTSRIGGIVEGEIFSHGLLIIDHNAYIKANITGDTIVVYGRVDGDINAKNKLELNEHSIVQGGINSPKLVVVDGAVIEGPTHMAKQRGIDLERAVDYGTLEDRVAIPKQPNKESASIRIAN